MKIRVLGAYGAEGLAQRPSAFLVNDTILIDGGTVGGALASSEQIVIEHALISHSHLDHIAGLAFLTETLALCEAPKPLTKTRSRAANPAALAPAAMNPVTGVGDPW